MNGDYKYAIQLRAEELADKRHGKEFYELPDELQSEIYTAASNSYWESFDDYMLNRADAARENKP